MTNKIEFIIVCENAFLGLDNKLNMIGVFDEITAPGFPALGRFSVATRIIGLGLRPFHFSLGILDEDGIKVFSKDESAETKNGNWQGVFSFENFVFPKPGKYKIVIDVGGISKDTEIIVRTQDVIATGSWNPTTNNPQSSQNKTAA